MFHVEHSVISVLLRALTSANFVIYEIIFTENFGFAQSCALR
jgi:hypothetical protein